MTSTRIRVSPVVLTAQLAGILLFPMARVTSLPAQIGSSAITGSAAPPIPGTQGRLPPVPRVSGPLAIKVAYPEAGSTLVAGDSSFLFGTVGDGSASLTINGHPVSVAPNGAWLAWVPLPGDSAFSLALVATRGGERVTASLPLRRGGWQDRTGAWVDPGSLSPSGRIWLPEGEGLPLTVRAAPGAEVRLRLSDGTLLPFSASGNLPEVRPGLREFDRDSRNLMRTDAGDWWVATLPATFGSVSEENWLDSGTDGKSPAQAARLEVILGRDTTRLSWPLDLTRLRHPGLVRLDDGPDGGAWRMIAGRPFPGEGTYTWFFPRGTEGWADARINNAVRLRPSQEANAWLPLTAVQPVRLTGGRTPVRVASLTLTPGQSGTSLRIPLTLPLPYQIDQGDRSLTIILHGAIGVVDWTRYGQDDPFVKAVTWRQLAVDRFAITLAFDRPLWGWRSRVDGSDLVFDFRRPPPLSQAEPLRGRRIVVDAGHPPGGACGPTGACESEINLAVAQRLAVILRQRGAEVILTRNRLASVPLRARSALADSLDAELFVSIHNNAFPDGINPFTNSGTSTFYHSLPSLPLAQAVQRELVARLGQRDLGVARGDLAVVRPTWYPAILTEALFLMFPEQENALRTDAVQQGYAESVARGIENFLRAVASELPE